MSADAAPTASAQAGLLPLRASALWAMARPSHLALILLIAAAGALSAVAMGATVDPASIGVAAAVLVLIAASVHYVNEWADHESDAITVRTPFSGGSGALAVTGLSPRLAMEAAVVTAVLGGSIAVVAAATGVLSPPSAVLLSVGGVIGWAYSVPPVALARRGLGELDNALAGGLVLPLFGYAVAADTVTPAIALAFLPFAMLDFANLLATTWPDRRADATTGKHTLATRWPVARLRAVHGLASGLSVALLIGLALSEVVPTPVSAAALATSPLIAWGAVRYTRQESPAPTVAAMVAMALALLLGWGVAAAT